MTPPTGAVLGHFAFHECNLQSFQPLPLLILYALLFLHDLGCAQGAPFCPAAFQTCHGPTLRWNGDLSPFCTQGTSIR